MYALDLHAVLVEYVNRACKRMCNFYSDAAIHDVESIRNMEKGEKLFFVVCPTNTHLAEVETLDKVRKEIVTIWGNHIVIGVFKVDEGKYYIVNYDKDLSHEWDCHINLFTQKQMDEFCVDEELVNEFDKL